MKKIVLLSTVVASLLGAEQVSQERLAEMIEAKKVKKAKASNGNTLDISLILDFSYTNQSFDEEGHTDELELPGLVHGGGHGNDDDHGHGSLAGEEGFKFNYAELMMAASVDTYFDLQGVFHLTEDKFEVEEAFVTSRALPNNLQLKLGKFKSDFGYLNNKHHHNYNFYEAPLVYNAFLGDHGLLEKGVQLQYVFPASHYVMAGVEVFAGENERSFGNESFQLANNADRKIDGTDFPSLWVGYLKTSLDIAGGTLLAGTSIAQGDSRMNHLEDEHEAHAFSGDSTLYGVDMTYKYYFAADHGITWQSEYLYRELDGTEYEPNSGKTDWTTKSVRKEQAGFYTTLVYQHDKNYRAGLRYSGITKNDISENNSAENETDDMYVVSAMLEYNPSEFSRIRLQYNRNSSLYDEDGDRNNKDEVVLQFNYAIGAHGAHAF